MHALSRSLWFMAILGWLVAPLGGCFGDEKPNNHSDTSTTGVLTSGATTGATTGAMGSTTDSSMVGDPSTTSGESSGTSAHAMTCVLDQSRFNQCAFGR